VVEQKREMIARIWIDAAGRISIQDKIVTADEVEGIMKRLLDENPALIVAFNAISGRRAKRWPRSLNS